MVISLVSTTHRSLIGLREEDRPTFEFLQNGVPVVEALSAVVAVGPVAGEAARALVALQAAHARAADAGAAPLVAHRRLRADGVAATRLAGAQVRVPEERVLALVATATPEARVAEALAGQRVALKRRERE